MATAMLSAAAPMAIQINSKGITNLSHLSHGTPPIAILAIKIPDVGVLMLVKPSRQIEPVHT